MAWWLFAVLGCVGSNATSPTTPSENQETGAADTVPATPTGAPLSTGLWSLTGCTGVEEGTAPARADVEAVTASPVTGGYSVAVTVRSPDEGCERYADWWEVVSVDGDLLYRRILNHSHVDEQPFTRGSEGAVDLPGADVVRVRAHLHPDGFGGQVLEGTFDGGFQPVDVMDGFADDLATAEPLPQECWF